MKDMSAVCMLLHLLNNFISSCSLSEQILIIAGDHRSFVRDKDGSVFFSTVTI